MKLYLSSYRIPNTEALFGLFDDEPIELKGAIITNAKDARVPAEREAKTALLEDYLKEIGLAKTERVDLRTLQEASVESAFAGYDYIFAMGGNTYDLRRAMLVSGFDKAIQNLLLSGIVYIGESAGAIVAGPSLEGFASMDESTGRDDVPREGLGLINTILVPHNDSADPRYANRAPLIQEANLKHKVIPLNDNQALVVNRDDSRIVSAS